MTVLDKLARPWPAVLMILAVMLAACGTGGSTTPGAASASAQESQSKAPEPNELTVLEWGGYEDPKFWTDFADANPTADVNFELGNNDADILGLMEGGSEADVFHFYTGWQQFYVDEGLVQEIDTSKLTNWDKVPDSFKALGQVNGKQYYIPWDWGFTSILYNTKKVPEVTSWDALFNPDYSGHIAMWDDGPAAVTVSSYVHGYDETAITDEQLASIEQEWKQQKPLNLHYWDSEYENLCPEVMSGDIWVAYAWQGCYATALYEGTPVAYANPKEGRNSWVGLYGISADSDSPDLALKFLDDKLAETSCGNAVTLFYYGCANADVMAAVTDPVLVQAFSIDDPSILENTNFTPPVTAAQRDAWTAMWTRVKAE
ncbi:MAG TPA: extracellular solute-binding protein [Candidatus Limnocylindria bacterium]|jgi:spermidine/putrescine transport system substrate-binding protein